MRPDPYLSSYYQLISAEGRQIVPFNGHNYWLVSNSQRIISISMYIWTSLIILSELLNNNKS